MSTQPLTAGKAGDINSHLVINFRLDFQTGSLLLDWLLQKSPAIVNAQTLSVM